MTGSITAKTAMDIALAYREIDTAEKLLNELSDAMGRRKLPDVRDAFGRLQDGLQLGVPSGDMSQRMFNVPWSIVKPVIELHIAHHRARIAALNLTAAEELSASVGTHPEGRDGEAGSVRSMGDAVPCGDTADAPPTPEQPQ